MAIFLSGRPIADRVLNNAGLLAVQADSDAGANDVIFWAHSYFVDSGDLGRQFTTDIDPVWWVGSQLTAANDPDSSGRYLGQTIGVYRTHREHAGIINPSLALFRPFGVAPNGQAREGGAYIAACSEMYWAWHGPLGNILS